jgi:hypothetical protein
VTIEGILAVDGPQGSSLAAWWPLYAFLSVFGAVALAAFISGRRTDGLILRAPRTLARWSGLPSWAATTLGLSIYGLVVAGFGFYTDVAWHVAYGRDVELFTAPHTAIFIGLVMIAAAPVAGIVVASLEGYEAGLRFGRLRVPISAVPLLALGMAALIGFPIDELWHEIFGVDVTMWSPPHLIMILAASFSGMASWLVLSDAGVRPTDGARARTFHVIAAALTLQGLSSVQGEFTFGSPQWQQLYHPVLICLAAGMALVIIRIVHGPWWALGIATAIAGVQIFDVLGETGPVETRAGGVYIGSAVAVELAARLLGTDRRLRFALASGVGVMVIGFPIEWLWNQGAHQPWTDALLPEAILVGALAALSAAIVGAAVAGAIAGHRGHKPIPAALVIIALLGMGTALGLPAPRRVGDVQADVRIEWVDADHAMVRVELDPPDAADGARWFTAGSWQWGGRTIAHMQPQGDGSYLSEEPLRMTGFAKSLLRLHRGAEMMAVALRLPADPEYGLAAVEPIDRLAPFVEEQRYLQREADPATGWFATLVYVLAVGLALAWIASFAWAARRMGPAAERVPALR